MPSFHVVYGLRLAANMSLDGLPLVNSDAFDLSIHFKEGWSFSTTLQLPGDDLCPSAGGILPSQPALRVDLLSGGEYFGLFYRDGTRFAVDRRGREVWADWPEDYTLEDSCTYLMGPVMGFVLRLRGTVCLHASSVAVADHALALVGGPGAGKSTTAAAFACWGFPVLSDDVVALTDKGKEFLVQPGYPRVNLWPDSVQQLFGSEDALPRITPTWDKRYLPLGEKGHHFASRPLPLGAIYILDGRDEALTAPVIEAVSREEAFMTLVANTYVNYLLTPDMRRTEFDVLGRLVSEVPVRRVRLPAEPSAIFQLCEAISADAKHTLTRVQPSANSVLV